MSNLNKNNTNIKNNKGENNMNTTINNIIINKEDLLKLKELMKESELNGFKQAEIIKVGTLMNFDCTEKYIKDIKGNKYTFLKGTAKFLDGTVVNNKEILFIEYDFERRLGEQVGQNIPMIYSTYLKPDGTVGYKWIPIDIEL